MGVSYERGTPLHPGSPRRQMNKLRMMRYRARRGKGDDAFGQRTGHNRSGERARASRSRVASPPSATKSCIPPRKCVHPLRRRGGARLLAGTLAPTLAPMLLLLQALIDHHYKRGVTRPFQKHHTGLGHVLRRNPVQQRLGEDLRHSVVGDVEHRRFLALVQRHRGTDRELLVTTRVL